MPRVRKNCPYPGCQAKHLVRLANHLVQVHYIKDKEERQRLLKIAETSNTQQPIPDLIKIVIIFVKGAH